MVSSVAPIFTFFFREFFLAAWLVLGAVLTEPSPDATELTANERQMELLQADEREVLFGGAKRGGKTYGSIMKAMVLLASYPGNRGLVIRQSLPDVRETWIEEFLRIAPPGFVIDHNKNDKKITIRNGSVLLYMGAGSVVALKAAEKKKGLNLGFAVFEEASEIPKVVYDMITAQLTWVLPDGTRPPYQAICTSNPEPGWVKAYFVGDLATGKPPSPGTRFIPALPKDNAEHLPPGWEEELRKTRDPDWIQKYLDGNWELSEGMVFGEFNRRIHLIEQFDFRNYKLLEALDHASTGVTAWYALAQDSDGNLFVLDEYFVRDKLVSQHAAEIHARRNAILINCFGEDPALFNRRENSPAIARFSLSLIDPSTLAKNQQTEKGLQSIQQLYADCGLYFSPAYNALEAGIERFKEYLHVNPFHRHPFTQAQGSPMLFIVKGKCPNLEREIVELRKEITAQGKPKFVGEDHGLDCIRYILNAQPKPPQRTRKDLAALPNQERHAINMHETWAKGFGKSKPKRWFSRAA